MTRLCQRINGRMELDSVNCFGAKHQISELINTNMNTYNNRPRTPGGPRVAPLSRVGWGGVLAPPECDEGGVFLREADLRRQEERGELARPALFLSLVLLSVLLYFVVSLSDPGFVRTDTESCEERQEMIPQHSAALRRRRCGYCLLLQPMRAKHCQRCRRCVRRYDHHCPWMENCVGERNHRSFVLFLAVQLVVLVWALQVAWSGFSATATWEAWLRQNGFLLATFCLMGVFSIVVLLLLGSHLYLVSLNSTTWEFMSRHRISYLKQCGADENPFDRGTFRNLRVFFCSAHVVAWEHLYTAGGADAVWIPSV